MLPVEQESIQRHTARIRELKRCPYVLCQELVRLAGLVNSSYEEALFEEFLAQYGLSTYELKTLVRNHFKHVALGCLRRVAATIKSGELESGRMPFVQLQSTMEHGELSPRDIGTTVAELRQFERALFPEKWDRRQTIKLVVRDAGSSDTSSGSAPTGESPEVASEGSEEVNSAQQAVTVVHTPPASESLLRILSALCVQASAGVVTRLVALADDLIGTIATTTWGACNAYALR